ncbi:MAG TPA: dihydropyrimidinase [Haloplasmataceae bacterium]
MGIVLKGGMIITASDSYKADIYIEGEKIQAIGNDFTSDEIIDVSGCYIFPGAIDCHTHFALETMGTITADDFATGTKAAIIGGTTAIIDYATQYKGESLLTALDKQFKKAVNCYCDFGFHMGITDWNESTGYEMERLMILGVTSFKLYMAYKNSLQVDDGVIYQALKKSKDISGLVTVHCENGDIINELVKEAISEKHLFPIYHAKTRPDIVEKEAISRVLTISELTGASIYIVHLSTNMGLESIIDAKRRGVNVFVETCPQYLLLDDSLYFSEGEKYIMSPPLRKIEDNIALWKGLSNNLIDTVATDHCSFNYNGQKNCDHNFSKIPNGAPGVEHRLALMYTYGVMKNRITLNQLVSYLSTNPAKIFGLFPNKGTIAVGSDADIVVYDPNVKNVISAKNQNQNVDYTPYEGFEKMGLVKYTFLRGRMIVKDEQLVENEPLGKYIYRKPFKGGM